MNEAAFDFDQKKTNDDVWGGSAAPKKFRPNDWNLQISAD